MNFLYQHMVSASKLRGTLDKILVSGLVKSVVLYVRITNMSLSTSNFLFIQSDINFLLNPIHRQSVAMGALFRFFFYVLYIHLQ